MSCKWTRGLMCTKCKVEEMSSTLNSLSLSHAHTHIDRETHAWVIKPNQMTWKVSTKTEFRTNRKGVSHSNCEKKVNRKLFTARSPSPQAMANGIQFSRLSNGAFVKHTRIESRERERKSLTLSSLSPYEYEKHFKRESMCVFVERKHHKCKWCHALPRI